MNFRHPQHLVGCLNFATLLMQEGTNCSLKTPNILPLINHETCETTTSGVTNGAEEVDHRPSGIKLGQDAALYRG